MTIDKANKRMAQLDKARAEIASLAALGVALAGNAFSAILFAKGEVTPTELETGLLGGADGAALRAACTALGYSPEEWAAMATVHVDGTELDAHTMRLAIATLDPATLVICDEAAADVVRESYAEELAELATFEEASLMAGLVTHVAGIRMLNLGGFDAALVSEAGRQRMWAYLKQLPPLGEPY